MFVVLANSCPVMTLSLAIWGYRDGFACSLCSVPRFSKSKPFSPLQTRMCCRTKTQTNGVWQKSDEKSDRSTRKSDQKVTKIERSGRTLFADLLLQHPELGKCAAVFGDYSFRHLRMRLRCSAKPYCPNISAQPISSRVLVQRALATKHPLR